MPAAPSSVWTNVEDEVLRAAISKYGLNQWSRVASLLARKTAKNCKTRWNEWLSPYIKKTAWDGEESAKLLALCKVMPTQWRTISQIVGRTASQCIEQYQLLLDEAERKEAGELGLVGDDKQVTSDDVRRLTKGDIDYDSASKPARPDAVDMDETELEMLSEARARLANTQGKKAKRKARERDLEQSRRVAALQKRRELKMSGINIKIKSNKKGELDYSADVPFERAAAPGFFDTQEEEEQNERQRLSFDPKKQQFANKRKGDSEENNDNRKKQKNDKSGQSLSAAAIKAAQMQKIREAEQSSKRRALILPTPQVGESELEDIVKMGLTGERATRTAGSNHGATHGLVANYAMANATPIRTPRAAPEEDHMTNELRNIRALNDNQSALLGGDNKELIEGVAATSFQGGTPVSRQIATPNPMATPFRSANGVQSTPGRTPRDTFRLNPEMNGTQSVGQTPRDIRLREAASRTNLLNKLATLPKAKALEFELELPEEREENSQTQLSEEDAAIRDARDKRIRDAAELAEFNRQTSVVQKRLPRPLVIDIDAMIKKANAIPDDARRAAAVETALLIANDALKFGGSRVSGAPRPIQIFDEEALQSARLEVALELSSDQARRQKDDFDATFAKIYDNAKLPGLSGYAEDEVDEQQMMVEAFDRLGDEISEAATRSNELEKKLAKLHGGYQQRAKVLRQKITEAAEALDKTRIRLNTDLNAQVSEQAAIPGRLERLRDEVALVSRREREAQEEYRAVKDELDGLNVNGIH